MFIGEYSIVDISGYLMTIILMVVSEYSIGGY
jgi:hypothetical protein